MKLMDDVGPRDEKMSSDPAIRLARFETPEDELFALSASQNCLKPSLQASFHSLKGRGKAPS